jgi:hypothetical protein
VYVCALKKHIYIYIYIEKERERERQREIKENMLNLKHPSSPIIHRILIRDKYFFVLE